MLNFKHILLNVEKITFRGIFIKLPEKTLEFKNILHSIYYEKT